MNEYTKEELVAALQEVCSIIKRCESMQKKIVEGTSQHTLLKNRIKAMYISKALIENESKVLHHKMGEVIDSYTKEELEKALIPISSVISKCEKAQEKFDTGTTYYRRFEKIIQPMYTSKSLIATEIDRMR